MPTDTRSNILLAALQLFLQKGYKDVSYQDLVKKTGLSKGAIYHYFESKEVLMIAVFEFLMEATQQPATFQPQNIVKDQESFIKLFVEVKVAQINSFKEIMDTKELKLNKLLFFFEAINENEQIKQTITALSKFELTFLEDCFIGLKNHNNLPDGKDTALLAECLYWMLQGGEMMVFFIQNDEWEEAVIKMYQKIINDFFKII
ncbi:MAG TPA: TetR/AcrR family transcriptional regulator [Mucilaginibacter sp.]|jgi:AcrR family transcriptional regulator